jgi:hypothetical protein
MRENDLWNMLSREDQELNGRRWSLEMAAAPELAQLRTSSHSAVQLRSETGGGSDPLACGVKNMEWTGIGQRHDNTAS